MREIIRIRPHHVLCIQNFTGKGYDKDFTNNMKNVITMLNNNPDTLIRLFPEEDCLCAECPHNFGGCHKKEQVRIIDKKMLDSCGYKSGEVVSWNDVTLKVKSAVFKAGRLREICGSCQWADICNSLNNSR